MARCRRSPFLRNIGRFGQAVDGAFDIFAQAINGQIRSLRDLENALLKLGNDIALGILKDQLKEWFNQSSQTGVINDILVDIGLKKPGSPTTKSGGTSTGPIGGAANPTVAQAQAAIQSTASTEQAASQQPIRQPPL